MTEKMKYIAAYVPAWGCYYVGAIISKIMHTRLTEWLFPIYSVATQWSLFFSDWGKVGVWLDIDE